MGPGIQSYFWGAWRSSPVSGGAWGRGSSPISGGHEAGDPVLFLGCMEIQLYLWGHGAGGRGSNLIPGVHGDPALSLGVLNVTFNSKCVFLSFVYSLQLNK